MGCDCPVAYQISRDIYIYIYMCVCVCIYISIYDHEKSFFQLTSSLLKKKPFSVTNQEHFFRGLQRGTSLETLKASNLFLLWSHFMVQTKWGFPHKSVLSRQLKSSLSCKARPPRSLCSDAHQITNGNDELSLKPFMTRMSYSDPNDTK